MIGVVIILAMKNVVATIINVVVNYEVSTTKYFLVVEKLTTGNWM
jgi:hypothetical protein